MPELQQDSRAIEYAEAVLGLARQIPPGRAMSYGLIAEIVGEVLHRGGPRQVGQVMAGLADRYRHLVPDDAAVIGPVQDNNEVPWWRVVYADGKPPAQYANAAAAAWRREAMPLVASGERIDLARAVWFPPGEFGRSRLETLAPPSLTEQRPQTGLSAYLDEKQLP